MNVPHFVNKCVMATSPFRRKTMRNSSHYYLIPIVLLILSACKPQAENLTLEIDTESPVSIVQTGYLKSKHLLEASGMHASRTRVGDFFVHNDEGKPRIYAIDETGKNVGHVTIVPAKNKDWEDITSIPVGDERWLVLGDIGDNRAKRKSIKLYFIKEPKPGKKDRYHGDVDLEHWISLTYPDGPKDCEAMAYDPVHHQLLFLSKRETAPHLYSIDLQTALSAKKAELTYLGETSVLRRPTVANRAQFGGRTDFISQPTGWDISPDGSEAVVITYRSLYRYLRQPDEDWLTAMQRKPIEVVGPEARQNEAIAYSTDGKSIYVTTEKMPAPVFRIQFKQQNP